MPSHCSLCAACVLALLPLGGGRQADRDDAANLALARDLTAYQPPLTQQFANTGHLTDHPPLALEWDSAATCSTRSWGRSGASFS